MDTIKELEVLAHKFKMRRDENFQIAENYRIVANTYANTVDQIEKDIARLVKEQEQQNAVQS